jgi:hypothetical protein
MQELIPYRKRDSEWHGYESYRKFTVYIAPIRHRVLYLSIIAINYSLERILNWFYEIIPSAILRSE